MSEPNRTLKVRQRSKRFPASPGMRVQVTEQTNEQ